MTMVAFGAITDTWNILVCIHIMDIILQHFTLFQITEIGSVGGGVELLMSDYIHHPTSYVALVGTRNISVCIP